MKKEKEMITEGEEGREGWWGGEGDRGVINEDKKKESWGNEEAGRGRWNAANLL